MTSDVLSISGAGRQLQAILDEINGELLVDQRAIAVDGDIHIPGWAGEVADALVEHLSARWPNLTLSVGYGFSQRRLEAHLQTQRDLTAAGRRALADVKQFVETEILPDKARYHDMIAHLPGTRPVQLPEVPWLHYAVDVRRRATTITVNEVRVLVFDTTGGAYGDFPTEYFIDPAAAQAQYIRDRDVFFEALSELTEGIAAQHEADEEAADRALYEKLRARFGSSDTKPTP
jgi:hypothetical protein